MRVIVAGAGETGEQLLGTLSQRDENEVVVIDRDEERTGALASAFDALAICGDATHPDVLERAQVRRADALVAVTGVDAVNVVIAMLAKRFEVAKIIVKLDSNALRAACKEIGVAGIVTPKLAAVTKMQALLAGSSEVNFSLLTEGGLSLTELPTGSAKNRPLAEVEFPEGSRLIGVIRNDKVVLPSRTTRFKEDDTLLFLVEDERSTRSLKRALELK